jgi:hypothetical protein
MNQPASHKCNLPWDHQEYQKRDEDKRDDGASRHAQVIVSPAPAEQIVSEISLFSFDDHSLRWQQPGEESQGPHEE